MQIFSLTYVSSASGLFDPQLYRDIAREARTYNARHAITGILLIYNETVTQFLEGPETEVSALYRRIEQDSRHRNPILISTRTLESRDFPDWSMGFEELTDLEDPTFIFSLNRQTLGMHVPHGVSKTTRALLDSYKQSSGMVIS